LYAIAVLLGCTATAAGDALAQAKVPDGPSSYFIVTRPDPRLCPSPVCGGYFVKAVNKPLTRCADGAWRPECHAGEVDASALGWSEADVARFNEQFGKRQALARGKLRQVERGSLKVDVLVLDEGWLGQAGRAPVGHFYRVEDSGIVCITFPCPSIVETALNFRFRQFIAGVDLAASGAAQEQVEAGRKALSAPGGILAAGRHRIVMGPSARGIELMTSEFYLPLLAEKPPQGQVCGGLQGLPCPDKQFCDIDTPNACNVRDPTGICRVPPGVCIQVYDPVCGCDGVTYSNDCERQAAQIQLFHPGECAGQ
jgi:hypothetical protein